MVTVRAPMGGSETASGGSTTGSGAGGSEDDSGAIGPGEQSLLLMDLAPAAHHEAPNVATFLTEEQVL